MSKEELSRTLFSVIFFFFFLLVCCARRPLPLNLRLASSSLTAR